MAFVGVNDKSLSDRLKVFIRGAEVTVCGLVTEGASRQITANWDSPFEQDTAGSGFDSQAGMVQERVGGVRGQLAGAAAGAVTQRGSGLAQSATGLTSITTMNTLQVWNGNSPHTFILPVMFYAINDAYTEVQAAIIALEKMAAPQLNALLPGGRVPSLVALSVGRMIIYPECVIDDISTDISGPISRDGYPLKALVNLTIQTKATLSQSEIAATFA